MSMYETEQLTNLSVRNNATLDLQLTVRDTDGADVDLTLHTCRMQLRVNDRKFLDASTSTGITAGPPDAPTTSSGITGISITDNVVRVTVPPALMLLIPRGRYSYDIVATSPDGVADVLLAGAITIEQGQTR